MQLSDELRNSLPKKHLKPTGKMAYLIPSSIFKNVFAQELRCFILPYLEKIIDFKTEQLFEKRLIASSIIVCNKSYSKSYFTYYNQESKSSFKIHKNKLNHKWIFDKQAYADGTNDNKIKFRDLFTAFMPIQIMKG